MTTKRDCDREKDRQADKVVLSRRRLEIEKRGERGRERVIERDR